MKDVGHPPIYAGSVPRTFANQIRIHRDALFHRDEGRDVDLKPGEQIWQYGIDLPIAAA